MKPKKRNRTKSDNAVAQCLREIARCEEYLRSGESAEMAGALQGLQDWTAELTLLADVDIG